MSNSILASRSERSTCFFLQCTYRCVLCYLGILCLNAKLIGQGDRQGFRRTIGTFLRILNLGHCSHMFRHPDTGGTCTAKGICRNDTARCTIRTWKRTASVDIPHVPIYFIQCADSIEEIRPSSKQPRNSVQHPESWKKAHI